MAPDGGAPVHHPWTEPPAHGAVREIAPGVLWMRLPLPMALDHVNAYALDDGDGWTVVDPGMDTAEAREIWGALLAGPLAGKPVVRVLATHYHPDHIGLAGWFQTRGASLWTTRTSWLFARMLTLDEQPLPAVETLAFWRAAGMEPGLLARRAAERPFNYCDTVHPLPLGYRRIVEGEVVRAGGRDWRVHIGHGHAPEHATLWSLDDDLVIGGDQLLPSISANLGVYATEPDADPVGDWLASCAALAVHAEERHLVLPGHKTPFNGLPRRLRQMAEGHEKSLARLEALIETPKIATACFPALYRREIGEGIYGLALVETVAHLNHLLINGRARRWRDADGVWLWQATSAHSGA
ncbi:MBL fold metallo-hydrolase [Phaeovulum sp.]|uniref:MBL fold metallo-hydrolase n=1 Tax=Phaeovulum sp. TaxID=2934796 RepID=UPI003565A1D0